MGDDGILLRDQINLVQFLGERNVEKILNI